MHEVLEARLQAILKGGSLESLLQEARATVTVVPGREWYREAEGLMIPSRAGFRILVPDRLREPRRTLVIGHEIGHTLFYDRSQLIPEGSEFSPSLPIRKDVWLLREKEERACDEIGERIVEHLDRA